MISQVRLRNDNRSWSKKGSIVRVNPDSKTGFLHAEYTDMGIIGTVLESKPPRHFCLINLINTVLWEDVIGVPDVIGGGTRIHVGNTPPGNPQNNDLWIDTSET